MTDLAKKRQEQLAQEGKEAEVKAEKPPVTDQPPPPQEEPAQEGARAKYARPYLPETDEECRSCGRKLKWIPVNTRVRAIVCISPRCPLYYQRLRTESDPPPKPAPKPAKKKPADKKKGEPKDAGTRNRSSGTQKPKEVRR